MSREFITNWRKAAVIEREVAEELRFHCEMLAQEYQARGLSAQAAKTLASQRFGDIDRIQGECVAIRKRNRRAVKLLKITFAIFFVAGVLLRVADQGAPFTHLGDVMVMTAVLGRLLLHARGLRTTLRSELKDSTLVLPRLDAVSSISPYDEFGRSPVERVLADKTRPDS